MIKFLSYINTNQLLKKTLGYIIDTNNANHNPYHNFDHNLHVANLTYKLTKHVSVTDNEKKNLIIAGLFHDYNHSGGVHKDDALNIKYAIIGFNEFYNHNETLFNNGDKKEIITLIYSTKYPIDNDKLIITPSIKIIRDADMLYTFTAPFFQSIILGLAKEFNITISDRIIQQIKFINNLKFNTDFGTFIWNTSKDDLLMQLSIYNKILN